MTSTKLEALEAQHKDKYQKQGLTSPRSVKSLYKMHQSHAGKFESGVFYTVSFITSVLLTQCSETPNIETENFISLVSIRKGK